VLAEADLVGIIWVGLVAVYRLGLVRIFRWGCVLLGRRTCGSSSESLWLGRGAEVVIAREAADGRGCLKVVAKLG